VSVETTPDPGDLAFLEAKVAEAAAAASGVDEEQELAVFMRHSDGTVAAGLAGVVFGGCLDLQSMWVDESLRGRGLTRTLFEHAEAEARRRGCAMVTLVAYDATTGRLFERMGYRVAGVIETAFAGTAIRWYRKDLDGLDALGAVADQNRADDPAQVSPPNSE
jgi:GNAT superfamily N-acetyltransferase